MKLIKLTAMICLCALFAPSPTGAQISAKLVMEDQRSSEHTMMLKWQWSADGTKLDAHLILSGEEILTAETWDLCFETEQGLAWMVSICRANKKDDHRKVQFKGREIRTVRGRAWLIETIKSS